MSSLAEYREAVVAYQKDEPYRGKVMKEIARLDSQSTRLRDELEAEQKRLYELLSSARLDALEQRGLALCSFRHSGDYIGGSWRDSSNPRGVFAVEEMRWVYERGFLPHYNSMGRTPSTFSAGEGLLFFTCPPHYDLEFEWGHNKRFNQADPILTTGIRSDVVVKGRRLIAIYPESTDVTDAQRYSSQFLPLGLDDFLGLDVIPPIYTESKP